MRHAPECIDVERQLLSLAEGTLPERARAALFAHAEGCDCCRALVDTYLLVVQLAREPRVAAGRLAP